MSGRRPFGVPGPERPRMEHTCGFDGGVVGGSHCGEPAAVHLFAADPEGGPGEYTMMACLEHFPAAEAYAWDHHDIAAVCDVPGTMWQSKGLPGSGFCFWPEAEAMLHESVSETCGLSSSIPIFEDPARV